jgi:UDP-N-acetylglucosamine 2-epimerase (non-hydrolysing)
MRTILKLAIILGTRPEIIKMSPIIRETEKVEENYFILHTGQHYSYNMDRVFFEQLKLPLPIYSLDVGSGSHGEQTGKMLMGIENVLMKENPDAVLVEGDTNTVLASALAAAKLHIKVGHVEAGLRSYDRSMPEEINRVLTDHCSDYLFAPTEKSRQILLREDIPEEKIFVGLPVIYPIHPRARKMMYHFGLKANGIVVIEPLDYLSFLQLESKARLVLTDSGGVQEETCILKVPCVTLRENTERPETLDVGSNILAGTKPEKILECVKIMLQILKKSLIKNTSLNGENPFGDGKAGEKIVNILRKRLK